MDDITLFKLSSGTDTSDTSTDTTIATQSSQVANNVYDTATKTVVESFEVGALSSSWVTTDAAMSFSLDNTGKMGGANCLKAVIVRSNNQHGIASAFYNIEMKFADNYDGIAFKACVDTAVVARVALSLKDYGQVYMDVNLTPDVTQYVIRFDDGNLGSYDRYKMPTDLYGTDFHSFVIQIGRDSIGPDTTTLYVDDITLFKLSGNGSGTNSNGTGSSSNVKTGDNTTATFVMMTCMFVTSFVSVCVFGRRNRKNKE